MLETNLSGFVSIWLFSNQLTTSSNLDFNISSKLVISLEVSYIVLSSSFMNKSNGNVLNNELCGTPETNIFNSVFLIAFQCYLFSRFVSVFLNRST